MSNQVELKLVEVESGNDSQASAKAVLDAEILSAIQQQVHVATGAAIEHAMAYADTLIKTLLDKTAERITQLSKPKMPILHVSIDAQETRKLSSQASPYLARMLINARLGLNTLLVGPAGSGKTFAASQLAESLGLEFAHLCMTAGASETWLFGRQTPNGFIEGSFSRLYKSGGVFLADEMDAADANLLLCINTALANGHMYNPISGETIAKHKDFVFVGAANTLGRGGDSVYTGRARLDAATLDRFVVLEVDYCPEIEEQLCPDTELRNMLQNARKVLRDKKAVEVISTRALQRAYLLKQAGVPMIDILKSVTAGWPQELVSQTELSVEAAFESTKKKKK